MGAVAGTTGASTVIGDLSARGKAGATGGWISGALISAAGTSAGLAPAGFAPLREKTSRPSMPPTAGAWSSPGSSCFQPTGCCSTTGAGSARKIESEAGAGAAAGRLRIMGAGRLPLGSIRWLLAESNRWLLAGAGGGRGPLRFMRWLFRESDPMLGGTGAMRWLLRGSDPVLGGTGAMR